MKTLNSRGKTVALVFFLGSALVSSPALAGHESSGGGDSYVVDFVRTATQEIYPWLRVHGDSLSPPIDATEFREAIDPRMIVSKDHVYESCDGSKHGREVEACFNADNGMTYLSRTLYPIRIQNTPSKRGLVAHEIFRKMSVNSFIEGDGYEMTRQISILSLPHSDRGFQPQYVAELGNSPALSRLNKTLRYLSDRNLPGTKTSIVSGQKILVTSLDSTCKDLRLSSVVLSYDGASVTSQGNYLAIQIHLTVPAGTFVDGNGNLYPQYFNQAGELLRDCSIDLTMPDIGDLTGLDLP